MKVLLVDDQRGSRLLLRSYIEAMGHVVIDAESGEDGITAFQSAKPDLVLMDVMMPGIDGYEATRRIRNASADDWVPVIFLSASDQDESIAAGIEAGGDDYLVKPVSQVVLGAKMQAMQRIADMRQQLLRTSNQLGSANRQLQKLVNVDGLTGIANRRYLDDYLSRELKRAAREKQVLSLVMADVDDFKKFNDHYGHQEGDDCLRLVAASLRIALNRPADLIARYGGEEFMVVLPDTDARGAAKIAETLRKSVEELLMQHAVSDAGKYVTLSLGTVTFIPKSHTPIEKVCIHADRALYQAKQAGRNQVFNAGLLADI